MPLKWSVSKVKPNPIVLKIWVGGNAVSLAFSEDEAKDVAQALNRAAIPENLQYSCSNPDAINKVLTKHEKTFVKLSDDDKTPVVKYNGNY